MRILATFLLWIGLALPVAASDMPSSMDTPLRLMMFEQEGCYWCRKWNREVAPAYPNTEEGKRAPLARADISEQDKLGLTLSKRVLFTPTFVLLQGTTEIGRIEGYPGEDFFWPLLAQQLQKTPAPTGEGNK